MDEAKRKAARRVTARRDGRTERDGIRPEGPERGEEWFEDGEAPPCRAEKRPGIALYGPEDLVRAIARYLEERAWWTFIPVAPGAILWIGRAIEGRFYRGRANGDFHLIMGPRTWNYFYYGSPSGPLAGLPPEEARRMIEALMFAHKRRLPRETLAAVMRADLPEGKDIIVLTSELVGEQLELPGRMRRKGEGA
jgi:hypothetical protein